MVRKRPLHVLRWALILCAQGIFAAAASCTLDSITDWMVEIRRSSTTDGTKFPKANVSVQTKWLLRFIPCCRDLHQIPELGFHELKTSQYVR